MSKKIFFALFLATFLLCQNAFSQSLLQGTVIDVTDGQSLVVQTTTRKKVNVRLRYLETPAVGQPLADVVKTHLSNLVLGKKISVTRVRLSKNVLTGVVEVEEKNRRFDLAQQMLRDGAGWFDILDTDASVADLTDGYREVENAAKNEKRGVWGVQGLKTPWESENERNEAAKQSKTLALVTENSSGSYPQSQSKSSNRTVDNRRLAIYDFDFDSLNKRVGKNVLPSENGTTTNQSQANFSTNLNQAYSAVFNKGSIVTRPFEFVVKNGKTQQKVMAFFGYDFSLEQSGNKNINKLGLLLVTEMKTKSFLQGKNVSLFLDKDQKVNLGVPKYKQSKYYEAIMFEVNRNEVLSISSSNSLTLVIGKSNFVIDEVFKQSIDEFVNTLK